MHVTLFEKIAENNYTDRMMYGNGLQSHNYVIITSLSYSLKFKKIKVQTNSDNHLGWG